MFYERTAPVPGLFSASHNEDLAAGLRFPFSNNRSYARAMVWGSVALIVMLVIAAVLGLLSHKRSDQAQRDSGSKLGLVKLTSDPGLSIFPAISPNGKLLVYASDRNQKEKLDLWLQNLDHRDPTLLVSQEADVSNPAFSPDNETVVFRSEREGGGICVISLADRAVQLVAKSGRNPKFSPDGSWIAYWAGEPYFQAGRIFIRSLTHRAEPRQLATDFDSARYPIWSHDASKVLFLGGRHTDDPPEWWVTTLDRAILRSDALPMFVREGFIYAVPNAWTKNYVYFSARKDDSTNLWRVAVSASGKIAGHPQRLTFGTSQDIDPSVAADGRVVFSSLTNASVNIWRMDLTAIGFKQPGANASGDLERVTYANAADVYPSISLRGDKLAFASTRLGKRGIWLKDLVRGTENMLVSSSTGYDSPRIAEDGSKVAYAVVKDRKWMIYTVSTEESAQPELVCNDCGPPRYFSRGNILFEDKTCTPNCIGFLNPASHVRVQTMKRAGYTLYPNSVSHDGRWLALHARKDDDPHRTIWVLPFRNEERVQESEWIAITDGNNVDREAAWSQHDDGIYFLSERDGFRCIWGQKLEPATKRPLARPVAIRHFHDARRSLMNVGNPGYVGLSVSQDKLMFSLAEMAGNIWMAR